MLAARGCLRLQSSLNVLAFCKLSKASKKRDGIKLNIRNAMSIQNKLENVIEEMIEDCREVIRYEAEQDGNTCDFSKPFYADKLSMHCKGRVLEALARCVN